jgi:hypothetical protein
VDDIIIVRSGSTDEQTFYAGDFGTLINGASTQIGFETMQIGNFTDAAGDGATNYYVQGQWNQANGVFTEGTNANTGDIDYMIVSALNGGSSTTHEILITDNPYTV